MDSHLHFIYNIVVVGLLSHQIPQFYVKYSEY